MTQVDVRIDTKNASVAALFVALMLLAPLGALTVAPGVDAQTLEDPAADGASSLLASDALAEEGPWNVVEGFTTKTGYRMVFLWSTDAPVSGIVRWGYAPDALDNTAIPVGSLVDSAQMAFMDIRKNDVVPGKPVYFNVLDTISGSVSPTKSFPLGNAWKSDASDGVYEINAVLQLDAKSLPDDVPFDQGLTDLARGIDIFAERVYDMTDGYVRIGKVIVTDTALEYPAYQPFGPGICPATQDVAGAAVQHTMADFVVQTTIPFDSHTWGGGTPVIDHPCTAFYIGRIGQLIVPWIDDAHLGYVMTHEFGHYALGLDDLYDPETFTSPRGCANRDPDSPGFDVSLMHNSGGWRGGKWDLSELDRPDTPCDRSAGSSRVSWDILRNWYPEIPAQGRLGNGLPDHSDSDPTAKRGNPDGDALDVFILNQIPGNSKVDHFIQAPEPDTSDPKVTILSPASGSAVPPTALDVSGRADRAAPADYPPSATLSADPKDGAAPLDVTFTLGASDPDGTIASWSLDHGDGTTPVGGSSAPPSSRSHTYSVDGTYTAILTVTDGANQTASAETTIIVGGGGATRIGTDPSNDVPDSGSCAGTAVPCDHAWTAGATEGFDLIEAFIEDRGETIRFMWHVADAAKFFVDPSGDPAAGDPSHITRYSLTTGFGTSPTTKYSVNLERPRDNTELRVSIGKVFGPGPSLTLTSPLGPIGKWNDTTDQLWADVPKSQFPELAALSTLSDLNVRSSFTQQGAQVQLTQNKDSLANIENDSYTVQSTLEPLGYGPSLLIAPKPAPKTVPADPHIQDAKGDAFIGGLPVDHPDIEAAWFDSDDDYLYVGLKVVDIPADPVATANYAYHVNFRPDWTSSGWGPSSDTTFTGLRVHASMDPTWLETAHTVELQVLYRGTTGNSYATLVDLPLSSIDAESDIFWFVAPRMALQSPAGGAKVTDLSADTALVKKGPIGGTIGYPGVWSDKADAVVTNYTISGSELPLIADPNGPYSGAVGETIALSGDASGGTPPYSCTWSTVDDGTLTDVGSCSTTITFDTEGDKTVTLTVTDAANATHSTDALVTIGPVGAERIQLHLSGDLLGSVALDTTSGNGVSDWLKTVDLTGKSGSHTLTATWIDSDGTILDTDSVDVVVEESAGAAFVTITSPTSGETVSGVVDVQGEAGHGAGTASTKGSGPGDETRSAFGPNGLFQEVSSVTENGEIIAQCAACHGIDVNGTEVVPGTLAGSTTWWRGPSTNGIDGYWFDIAGLESGRYTLEPWVDSAADIVFFANWLDAESAQKGSNVGPDLIKTGTIPVGSNWAFVYLRRTTAEGLGALDTAILTVTPPLSAPRDVTGSTGWDTITMSWSAPEWDGGSEIVGYDILRNGTIIDGTTDNETTTFTAAGYDPGVSYTFTVRARNATHTGPESKPLVLTTGNDLTAPGIISGLTTTNTTFDSATLAWDAATDPETGVSYYRVLRDGVLRGTTSGTTFIEAGLAEETTYTYSVSAVNGQGLEGPASTTTATTTSEPLTETVSLYVDGTHASTVYIDSGAGSTLWTISWDTRAVADGTYRLHAVYDDGRGATAMTDVTIEVDNVAAQPYVNITAPQNGTTTGAPIRFKGDLSATGDTGALALNGGAAETMGPMTGDWLSDPWVRDTLQSATYKALLGTLETLDGYLLAYPSSDNGQAVVVLLDGPVPSDAPTSGIGVPIRYVTGIAPQPLAETTDIDAPAMTLDEFEAWKGSYVGPAAPSVQQKIGPGGAIHMSARDANGVYQTYICSASYLLEDPYTDKYYLATAGHCLLDADTTDSRDNPAGRAAWIKLCVADCVSNMLSRGTYVKISPAGDYHPVAFARANGIGDDFGLIEIPQSLWSHLRPYMWFWGGPTQFERPEVGDLLTQYGHGVGYGAAFPTQGRMHVALGGSKETGIRIAGFIAGGDSGSAFGTAFPRTDELLMGDGASGAMTHGITFGTGIGFGVAWGNDLEDGLETAGMQHLRLVTEDEEIRVPGEPAVKPQGGPEFVSPAEGVALDPAMHSPVNVTGTMEFTGQATQSTATKTYYLHRETCTGDDRLWMDTIRRTKAGSGCGSLVQPVGPLFEVLIDNGFDDIDPALAGIYAADPLPAATTWLDQTRKIGVSIYEAGLIGEEPTVLYDYEARLSYGGVVVAEKREQSPLHVDSRVYIEMDPLVDQIPAAAELTLTFVVHQATGIVFIGHDGKKPSNVELPLAEPPEQVVQVSLDDPAFDAANLLPVQGAAEWTATWDLSGVAPGDHTLYARAIGNGAFQGDIAARNFTVAAGALDGPTAGFSSQATDLTVQFTDRSVAGDGVLTDWWWTFGDGATSTETSPNHTYAADGTYEVALTVTDFNGLSDTVSTMLTVDDGIIEYVLEGRLMGPTTEAFGWTEIDRILEGEAIQWEYLWDPSSLPEEGNHTFEVRVLYDGVAVANDTAWFFVDTNRAPVFDPVPPQGVEENSELRFSVHATDADDDPLTLSATGAPTNATFTDHGNGTGTFSWTPATNERGVYEVVFTADDGALDGTVAVGITVFEEDLPPVLDPIADQSVAEGQSLALGISASDANGDLLTLKVAGLPSGATVAKTGPGLWVLSWTPTYQQNGVYDLNATVSDGTFSDWQTFRVTVTDVDVAPVVVARDQTIIVGTTSSSTMSATDADGDAVVLSASGLPGWVTFKDLGGGLGHFSYSAPPAASGQSWTITVNATSTEHTTTDTFVLKAIGFMRLEMSLTGPSTISGAPGLTGSVGVKIKNTGISPGFVTFQGSFATSGWSVGAPENVYLEAGDELAVRYTFTPGDKGSLEKANFRALALEFPNTIATSGVQVRIPVRLAVELDETSAVFGTEGTIRATFIDGSPAPGVDLALVDRHSVVTAMVSQASGTTDENGTFTFRFDTNSAGGNLPGGHTLDVDGSRDGRIDKTTKTYTVTV